MVLRTPPFTLAGILSLLCIPFVCALPPPNCTSTPTLIVTDSPSSSHAVDRTMWSIIWSCVATILACSWTAIHLNVPGMDEKRIVIFRRRLFIMVLALTAPELMVTWATIQFLSARDTAKVFNDVFSARLHRVRSDHPEIRESTCLNGFSTSNGRNNPHPSTPHIAGHDFRKWTTMHGFFAWMGGFVLYYDNKPQATLTPKELIVFISEGSVDIPDIVEADMEGRSKSDGLSKLFSVLQLGWFVLQLGARYIQHLPATLLEIDTLAVVTLACIAYCLWWKKPKDVRRPYVVHWKKNEAPPPDLTYNKQNSAFSFVRWYDYLDVLIYPLRSLMGTGVTISPHSVRAHRVPSLGGYADDDRHDRNHVITLFLGCFSAVIYGGLHCLGWNCFLQWHAAQMLWRAASITIASASIPFLLVFGGVILLDVAHDSWVVKFTVLTTSLIYTIARIAIIVLILLSFQSSLSPGIYDTVAWTTFFPHF